MMFHNNNCYLYIILNSNYDASLASSENDRYNNLEGKYYCWFSVEIMIFDRYQCHDY